MILPDTLQEVGKRVRVLRDRVLIYPLDYKHPVLETVGVDVNKGVVIAVGYGRRSRLKTRFDQKEGAFNTGKSLYFEDGGETGKILPMRVKVGDVVEFSARNFELVDFDRLFDHSEDGKRTPAFPDVGHLLFVWQNAIMTIDTEESLHESMLWQQSAGYDRHGNFMSGQEAWNRGV